MVIMKKINVLLIILFTTTVLILGLITTFNSFRENLRTDDLKDISINPEKYLNKKVTVIGYVYKQKVPFDYRENGIKYDISEEDEYGFYSISLKTYKGGWVREGRYRVKGIINYVNVCICDYRCVDYKGDCVYTYKYLFLPNFTIRNFKTNLTSNPIKDYWYPNYYYYSKIIDYLCPVNRRDYFECSYEMKKGLDAFNFEWQKFEGTFYKEYRCRPNSFDRIYYIEATEPMVRI